MGFIASVEVGRIGGEGLAAAISSCARVPLLGSSAVTTQARCLFANAPTRARARATRQWPSAASLLLALLPLFACSTPQRTNRDAGSSSAQASASSSVATGPTESTLAPFVADLRDVAKRDAAIKRLSQAVTDAFAADQGKTPQPNVERTLNTVVEPLTASCVHGDLPTQLRNNVVKLLADTHDPRARPCLKKALEDYRPDSDGEDVTNVLLAIAQTKDKALLEPLMTLFRGFQFSKAKAKPLGQRLLAALEAVVDGTVEADLLALIASPMPDASNAVMDDVLNQGYWQKTAASLLGELRAPAAVRPLLQMVLSPAKAPLAMTALIALVKIGTPSVAPTVALLRGEDRELIRHSESEQLRLAGGAPSEAEKAAAKRAHVSIAAEILGNIGTATCGEEILAAMAQAEPLDRSILALSLTRVPSTAPIVDAYKRAAEETDASVELPSGSAKAQLLSRVSDFADPKLVTWLLPYAKTAKAPADERAALLQASFIAAVKLMTAEQIKEVEAFGATEIEGAAIASSFTTQLQQASELLRKCGTEVNCYLEAVKNPDHQDKAKEFIAVKALHMLAAFGDPKTRDTLVELLPGLASPVVRSTALLVVERLTPRDGKAVAAKLRAFHERALASKDSERTALTQPFLQTAARLDNR